MKQISNLEGVSEAQLEGMIEASYLENVYSKYLKPGDIIYDIGAFRGVLSVLWAEDGYEILAFEGSPRNVPFLEKNTASYDKVFIHDVALHERNFKVKTRFNDCIGAEHPEQDITYRELDEYIISNDLAAPTLVKMDIEGMESVVLKKATRLIKEVRPIWQLSLHENHGWRYDNYPAWVGVNEGGFDFSMFSSCDYQLFDTHN